MSTFIDMTGQKFGRLTVLKKDSKQHKDKSAYWICQCDCGNTTIVKGASLRNGNTTSCGCSRRKNLIGQKFGHLTVIEYTNESSSGGSAIWKCQCDCGNITYASTTNLQCGYKKSCGCAPNLGCEKFKERQKTDLVGKKFGKLTVLSSTDMRSNKGNQIWKCQCECGNICYISTNHLQTGNTKSCGCLQGHSAGELEIKNLLLNNNIKFKQEYSFKDDYNTRRYDFAILDQNDNVIRLIEFDGEQHYIETSYFQISLLEQQNIDKEKEQFAKLKNIELVRVPYWKRGNITLLDLGM